MKTAFKTLAAAAALAVPSVLSAQVQIIGTATGCFFQGPIGGQCTTGSSNVTLGNLTYLGGSFDVVVGPSGELQVNGSASDNLGRFVMSSSNFNFDPPGANNTYGFRLFISIVSPITTPGGVNLIATLDGDLNVNSNGDELEFDFSNSFTTFTYADGSFRFRATDEEIGKGDSEYLGFKIDCGDRRNGTCEPATQVAEPASFTLVAAGLAGLIGAARRRRDA